jgi:hypothetical protein
MNKYLRRQLGISRARRVLLAWRNRWWRQTNGYYDVGGKCEKLLIKTRVPCSCAGCGNPRRHFGRRTRQETLAELEMHEDC